MIGIWQLVLVAVIVLLIFGPKRITGIGGALGKSIRGFKKGLEGEESESHKDQASKEDDKTDPKV